MNFFQSIAHLLTKSILFQLAWRSASLSLSDAFVIQPKNALRPLSRSSTTYTFYKTPLISQNKSFNGNNKWLVSKIGKRTGTSRTGSSSLSMCICINCKFVTNCSAYHFVEERHDQPHMSEDPTFTPADGSPTIHVNIRSEYNAEENKDRKKMWREYKREEAERNDSYSSSSTAVAEKVDTATTTFNLENVGEIEYEYDVVKCKSYVEEMGCWVANMPKEIRDANPDFIPT